MRSIVAVIALALAFATGTATAGATGAVHAGLVTKQPGAFGGYTLVASDTTPKTYLVDLDGNVVHSWTSDQLAGVSAYLLPNGLLLRAELPSTLPSNFAAAPGGQGGVVQEIDWDGNVKYSFTYADQTHLQHHDAIAMPNGHILMLAWDYKTAAEAIAMGRDPSLLPQGSLWPDSIVEVDPAKDAVVWEWHAWDHLIQDRDPSKPNYGNVAKHPEKIDLNYATAGGQASWQHFNGLDYNAKTDQILVSTREFSEIWVINHHTTTAQAKGKAGDLVFRWGNPLAYKAGNPAERELFFQHNPQWIPAGLPGGGHIMVFNNGDAAARPYTTVDEIVPQMKGKKYVKKDGVFQAKIVRRVYPVPSATSTSAPPLFAPFIGGAQRLPNGDTLINDGPDGRIFEINKKGDTVWAYQNAFAAPIPVITAPTGFVIKPERLFRAYRYSPSYSGLQGKGLDSGSGSSTGKSKTSY